jgi:molecular chaperone GrpE (heat shock protein)
MRDSNTPLLAKWPFFLGNAVLLFLAWFLCHQSKRPMSSIEVLACVACVGLGAFFSLWPFILEYRFATKLVETGRLTGVVAQIQNLDQLACRIDGATARWQTVQESADKTARTAKEIAEGMANEVKAFNEFLVEANDNEKGALRLEVEKLRRVEGDWVNVLVRILDHVHAINRAAALSGQPNVVEQLSRFQNACHDAARRVGLTPFVAAPADKFDPQRHQLMAGQSKPVDSAFVDDTVASGYTFQGRLIRPALVRLRNGSENTGTHATFRDSNTQTAAEPAEKELPLS